MPQIIQGLIALVVLVVGYFAARYLNELWGAERFNRARGEALEVVKQVEQQWRSRELLKDERHDAAFELLLRRCPWLTEEQINNYILSALGSLKIVLREWEAKPEIKVDSTLPPTVRADPTPLTPRRAAAAKDAPTG
jgi:hypothetical protein